MYIERPTNYDVTLEEKEKKMVEDGIDVLENFIEAAESHGCDVFETKYEDTFTIDELENVRQFFLKIYDVNQMF